MSHTLATDGDDKPDFNYKAFSRDLKGETYGVSDVVKRRSADPTWHSKQILQLSETLKAQHAQEGGQAPNTNYFSSLAAECNDPSVNELKRMRKEGLYSFQKNYASMEDIRLRRDELHEQDKEQMMQKYAILQQN